MFSDDAEGLSNVDSCDEELEPVENAWLTLVKQFKQKETNQN